jgi:hypothetical protein
MAVGRDYPCPPRYIGSKGRIWNNVSAKGIGYLTPSGMYRAKLSQRLIDNSCTKERYTEWVLVSDQYNYVL